MSGDLHELLKRTADAPTRPLNLDAVVRRARRRSLIIRTALGLTLVVAVAAGTFPMLAGGERGLDIADRPGAGDRGEVAGRDRGTEPRESAEAAPGSDAPSVPPHSEQVERRALALPAPVDLQLLAIGAQELSNQLAVIDLASGERVVYPPGTYGPASDGIQAAAVTDVGTVVLSQHGVISAFRDRGDASPVVYEPELINEPGSAPSISLVAANEGDRVWLVQVGHGGRPGSAELLDLEEVSPLVEAELPSDVHPVAATASGLALNENWQAVSILTEDGRLEQLTDGEALGVAGEWVAVRTCETPAQDCELALHHLESGEQREVSKPVDGEWIGVAGPSVPTSGPRWWRGATSDGRLLLGVQAVVADGRQAESEPRHLVVVDPDLTGHAEVVAELDGTQVAAWALDGRQIVLIDTEWETSQDLTVIDISDGSTFAVPDAIPPRHFVLETS